ncbi:hypothetical protein SAMN04488144_13212 [Methylobacterium sp. 190mf]|uniref:hypothetical protein n=1 Tax=Methylobacterium sp. 190mf TaxID=1761798 RepID=UPI00089E1AFB|nr:hypothetical protein [Methylobacterium sp. 190mf]SEG64357.1 hypothetical protein SAMN04488144_13212 [Methylobacterium sp. 190mf]
MSRENAFDRPRGAAHVSVGLYDPADGRDPGEDVVFGPGEVVRVRDPQASVVVQAIGRPLPDWVTSMPVLDRCPTVELVLLHEASWAVTPSQLPPRLRAFSPQVRWIVHAAALADRLSGEGVLPHAALRISAPTSDLDTVGLALAAYTRGCERLIGCDLSDILAVTGTAGDLTADGCAVVVEGRADESRGGRLSAALAALAAEGFEGGRLLIQLLRAEDFPAFTLERFDACITAAHAHDSGRSWVATILPGRDRTALVLIAFRLPHATPATLRMRAVRAAHGAPHGDAATRNPTTD